ncbi:MAG: hypothetical protein JNL47_04545 [Bacteroidia bacterium]|nr:hypothetical protein [Bacteroidia bacterium]
MILLAIISGVSINPDGKLQSSSLLADSTDLNPNGSSELSLLMRKMHQHALKAREEVLKNKPTKGYPAEFEKIYTATPTTPTTKNQYYNSYADLYLAALKNFSKSNKKNLKENYNNLVSGCVVCHTTHCPGPMVLIEKLPIE